MDEKQRVDMKKREPFSSPEEEAILNLVRTNDRFQLRFARLFREHGLTSSQYNVLRILREEGAPLPCLEIAERMIASVPGITGLVDRLEAMGFVVRDRSTEDRRVVYVGITPTGVELLSALDGPVDELHKALVGHLTCAEVRELSRLLEKARQPTSEGNL